MKVMKRGQSLGLRAPSNCDRSVDNRDKKRGEKCLYGNCPRMRPSGNQQAILTLPSAGKGTAPPR